MSRIRKYPKIMVVNCSYCHNDFKTKQWNKMMHTLCAHLKSLERARIFNEKKDTRRIHPSAILSPSAIKAYHTYPDRDVPIDYSIVY
jgi:hypothetical protein